MEWSFEDARERFDELLDAAAHEGPQEIVRDGKRFLIAGQNAPSRNTNDFIDFLTIAPDREDMDRGRDKRPLRDVAWSERNRLVEIIANGPSWDGIEIDGLSGKMRNIELE